VTGGLAHTNLETPPVWHRSLPIATILSQSPFNLSDQSDNGDILVVMCLSSTRTRADASEQMPLASDAMLNQAAVPRWAIPLRGCGCHASSRGPDRQTRRESTARTARRVVHIADTAPPNCAAAAMPGPNPPGALFGIRSATGPKVHSCCLLVDPRSEGQTRSDDTQTVGATAPA
jgi:hypothetical protein